VTEITARTGHEAIDEILGLFATEGARSYGEERVSQLAHGLQCAWLAEQAGASSELVVAALLHDIGHLVDGGDRGLATQGVDARHEDRGSRYLSAWFGPGVTEPVRLHVAAKRYLCQVDDGYFDLLSPASVRSLEVQGGIYSPAEADQFAADPHGPAAAQLRRWDDEAKDPTRQTPGLTHFRRHLEAALSS